MPDTRPHWDDPNLRVPIDVHERVVEHGKFKLKTRRKMMTAAEASAHTAGTMKTSAAPVWQRDPTYNLRGKGRKK